MQNKMSLSLKSVSSLLLIVILAFSGLYQTKASAAGLLTSTCSGAGTGIVTCDLWATSGVISLPAPAPANSLNVNILGYTAVSGAVLTAPGGPILIANQGDVVTVTLHNGLSEATSLMFLAQSMIPDSVGVTTGSSKSYTFTASNPGTFLYEAGLTPNAEHLVAMGLYGTLIVRPSTSGQAYNSATTDTSFADEALVQLSEIDPALNNRPVASGGPAAFDMRNYHPAYWLINGKTYPNTDPITTLPGNRLLLRYVNAGIQPHSMSLLGIDQTEIAMDGSAFRSTRSYVAETLAPGQTVDAIVTPPAAVTAGTLYALYDASLTQHDNNSSGFGGMLTFISAGTAAVVPPTDTTGPATTSTSITPSQTNGSVTLALNATVSDVASGGANVTAAEFFIDALGANGSGTAMTGTFGSPTASVNAVIPIAVANALATGNHTIYVHGQDANNNWGAFNLAILTIDKAGPVISGLSLSANPVNGTADVNLTGSANDSTTGGSNITSAQYTIDGGAGVAMILNNTASPISGLSAVIPAATVIALPEGAHVIVVTATDSLGNTSVASASSTITLNVDKTGPTSGSIVASPNPNNGTMTYNTSIPAVRVMASFSDALSNLQSAEAFIDVQGVNGTGTTFIANGSVFNSLNQAGYADFPIASIAGLPNGAHTIYVHAEDAAGNWGPWNTAVLTIDKSGPAVSAFSLTPPASNNTAVTVSVNVDDSATGGHVVAGGEFFVDTVPGAAHNGTAMTPTVSMSVTPITGTIPAATIAGLSVGVHTVYVRAVDVLSNWSTVISGTLLIDRARPTFTGFTITPGTIFTGTPTVKLTIAGAVDPLVAAHASGVAGGEYWFGNATIAAGTGTPFSGLTPAIDTSNLPAGTVRVNVRVVDVAGNWSSGTGGVRTANLIVNRDPIFSNGFEAGNTSGWSASAGSISVNAAAAMVGNFGLQAAGNGTNYIQYNYSGANNPATGTFDGRFYFNPNFNTGTNQDIFVARPTANGTVTFKVRYRWNNGLPQVQIQVGTATTNTTWSSIVNGSANYIEVVWQAAGSGGPNPGTLNLYVNGVLSQTVATTSTSVVGSFRLGSVASGGGAAVEYFDAMTAKHTVTALIGQ